MILTKSKIYELRLIQKEFSNKDLLSIKKYNFEQDYFAKIIKYFIATKDRYDFFSWITTYFSRAVKAGNSNLIDQFIPTIHFSGVFINILCFIRSVSMYFELLGWNFINERHVTVT